MRGPLKEQWNEFDWEAELKKDDARVDTYMRELPRYIDLPAEDAVIMKHIQEKPDLVPFNGDYRDSSLYELFEENEVDEEVDFSDDWQKRDGADFFIVAGRLARLWAQYFASETSPEQTVAGMRILCLYGKVMARGADLIDMEDDEYPALRIALVKRLLSDVNQLMGELQRLSAKIPSASEKADFHFEHLMTFREKVLALLAKYRSAKS